MAAEPRARHSVAMVGVSFDHTSVPRWPALAPAVDLTGTSYLVVSAGASAVASAWIAELAANAKPTWTWHDDLAVPIAATSLAVANAAATALSAELNDASVGVRILLSGPELVVLDCARAARGAGAIDAEITQHVTGTEIKRVHCTHCGTPSERALEVAVGDTLICGDCDRELVVYHHVSRQLGAYMAFMADAEALPE